MSEIIPLFSTSSSLKSGGIFTVEKAGAMTKSGRTRGPVSLCDLAKEEKLAKLFLVQSNFVDFMPAWKNLKDVGTQMVYGLKLVVCENLEDKSEASFKTESKVIVFLADDTNGGYRDLIKIYTKAATDGFYYVPRIDWKTLNKLWSDRLILALPFYSSFLAKNTLTFASIVPDLPVKPVLLSEEHELPFDGLIGDALVRYGAANSIIPTPAHSIYYKRREDSKAWLIWQCILNRSTWDKPNMDHCASKEFSWESFKELTK